MLILKLIAGAGPRRTYHSSLTSKDRLSTIDIQKLNPGRQKRQQVMDFGAGAVFGAINTAFKFSEFVIALNEVGSENNVFVRTIQRVRLDLEEIERLLAIESVKSVLYQNPQKTRWVKEAIFDTKTALNDIGLFVERVRSDKDRDGEIGFGNRVRWVLKDHGKIENRRSELAACHQTLTTVLASLHPLEAQLGTTQRAVSSPTMFTDDAPPPSYADAAADSDFRSPYQRKKGKMKKSEVDIVEVTQDMQEQGNIFHSNFTILD